MNTKIAKERKRKVEAARVAVRAKELCLGVTEERFDLVKSTVHNRATRKPQKVGAG